MMGMTAALVEFLRRLPRGYYSDRQIAERRTAARRCICPSHASNRGECPVHDEKGRPRAALADDGAAG
jgi:hypothetical protein